MALQTLLPVSTPYNSIFFRTQVFKRPHCLSSRLLVSQRVLTPCAASRHQHKAHYTEEQPHKLLLTFQNVEDVLGCIPVYRLVAWEEVLFRRLHSPLNFIRSEKTEKEKKMTQRNPNIQTQSHLSEEQSRLATM